MQTCTTREGGKDGCITNCVYSIFIWENAEINA